ncbi:hypothetical protein BXP70_27030 [Hymenobacter crusticola]|uniref:Uncharacterized protein n=2 Tax=Hymenobacter crusticola TaxID=1770526 RepID=A0A243W5R7_9BACT|nr:hypothetical protein BXP70_27030 [Hymenobacter crusticola]
MPNLLEKTHGLGPFLFLRYYRLRILMKNPSRFFSFVATLSLLLALAGIFMVGYYSGRNDSLAKLGWGLCWGGILLVFASVMYKKQKGNPDSPR